MRHFLGFDSASVAEIDSTAEVGITAPLLGTLGDLVKVKEKKSQFTEYLLLRCWLLLWWFGFLTWLLASPSQSLAHTGKLVDKKQFSTLGLHAGRKAATFSCLSVWVCGQMRQLRFQC